MLWERGRAVVVVGADIRFDLRDAVGEENPGSIENVDYGVIEANDGTLSLGHGSSRFG